MMQPPTTATRTDLSERPHAPSPIPPCRSRRHYRAVADKPLVRPLQSLGELDPRAPAQRTHLARVEQLPGSAVGFAPIPFDRTIIANRTRHRLGQLSDRYLFARPD